MKQVIIPFSQLYVWDGNVRTTSAKHNLDELAASIAASGLLQPLVVHETEKDRYMVIAGRRRFYALGLLAARGALDEADAIPCSILDKEANLVEVSLAENVTQLPMHPADRFIAFKTLVDQGMSAQEVAVRFGIGESSVHKLLRLGNVSPAIMAAYRESRLDYEQVQAFTISEDQEEQNRLLQQILTRSTRTHPSFIRAELVGDEVSSTDKRVQFVGLAFYEMCGGAVRRDLFDSENSGYVQDKALLSSLVEGKIQSEIDRLKAEGWSWVEYRPDYDRSYWRTLEHLAPLERDFTAEEAEEYARLEAMAEECEEDGEEYEALATRMAEMQRLLQEWTPEMKAGSGVLISLHHRGTLEMDYGRVKPLAGGKEECRQEGLPAAALREKDPASFSQALQQNLDRHRTAALRAELAGNPRMALVAVTYTLASCAIYHGAAGSCLALRSSGAHLFNADEAERIPAMRAVQEKLQRLALPEHPAQLWDWLLTRDTDELHALLAVCAALSVNAVPAGYAVSGRDMEHSRHLAQSLNMDMRQWYRPTAENFFTRISKRQILEAYREATGKEPSESLREMKKSDLAARADREIGDIWLPPAFRPPEASAVSKTSDAAA